MLEVPYFKQTTSLNCGAVALQMVLSFFGDNRDLDFLEELTGTKREKAIATLEIGTAAAKCGYEVSFYSTCLRFNPQNIEMEFYQRDTAMNQSYVETIGTDYISKDPELCCLLRPRNPATRFSPKEIKKEFERINFHTLVKTQSKSAEIIIL